MNSINSQALVVHGGGVIEQYDLTFSSRARMDTAVEAWQNNLAPYIVASGGYSYRQAPRPLITEAEAMRRHAIEKGVPDEALLTEGSSFDTVGNAVFTKTDVVIPNDWEHLTIITSGSHLPRALSVFRHVFGPDFNVKGISAPEDPDSSRVVSLLYEPLAWIKLREVLRGTEPGDHEAIRERMFDLVPGYGQATMSTLAVKSVFGLLKRSS